MIVEKGNHYFSWWVLITKSLDQQLEISLTINQTKFHLDEPKLVNYVTDQCSVIPSLLTSNFPLFPAVCHLLPEAPKTIPQSPKMSARPSVYRPYIFHFKLYLYCQGWEGGGDALVGVGRKLPGLRLNQFNQTELADWN